MKESLCNPESGVPEIADWSAAELALAAYEPDQDARMARFESLGYGHLRCIDVNGVQAVCGVRDGHGHVVLAFAGTNDWDDLWADLNARRVDVRTFGGLSAGSVHGGAVGQLKDAWTEIGANALVGRRLFVIGHSLGGMLAGLAATNLHLMGVHVSGVRLFGCPRFSDRAFASYYDDVLGPQTNRYVNCTDVITRLPPPAPEWAMRTLHRMFCVRVAKWLIGLPATYEVGDYRHVGVPVYINSDGLVIRSPRFGYVAADRIVARFEHPLRGPADHRMQVYQRLLRACAMRAIRAGSK